MFSFDSFFLFSFFLFAYFNSSFSYSLSSFLLFCYIIKHQNTEQLNMKLKTTRTTNQNNNCVYIRGKKMIFFMYVNVHVLFLSGCTCTCMLCILNKVFCILNCECGIEAIVNRMFLKKKSFLFYFSFLIKANMRPPIVLVVL